MIKNCIKNSLSIFVMIMLLGTTIPKVSAYACPTHTKILKHAMTILSNDNKEDIYDFFKNSPYYSNLMAGTIEADIDEANPGAHYYIYSETSSSVGNYYKNSKGAYSRSARTNFEEHYSTALNMYFSGYKNKAFNSLGKAIHYLSDISCTAHSTKMTYSLLSSKNPHKMYETYITNNSDKFTAYTANEKYDYVLYNPFSEILNNLSKQSSQYEYEASSNIPELYDKSIENTVPTAEKLTAAVLNRFYRDINNLDSIKYIEDGKEYYIKNAGSSKYITVSGNNIVQDSFQQNDSQRFKVSKNFDGSFTLTPACSKKILSVKWNWKSFRFDNPKLSYSLIHSLSNYFKPVFCENGYFRIMTGLSKYTEVLNVQNSSQDNGAKIYCSMYDPDEMSSYWIFEECQ